MKARIVLMGGMGFPATETPWGMPALKQRFLNAAGVSCDVLLVSWSARQEVYNFSHDWDGFLAMLGDSLGAGSAGQYPRDIKRNTDFAGGFQPSDYDARSRGHVQIIAPRIINAHCVYDPYWIDTGGLGHAHWEITPGSKTRLLTTEHRGAHPDDWGYSQDLLFNQVMSLIK